MILCAIINSNEILSPLEQLKAPLNTLTAIEMFFHGDTHFVEEFRDDDYHLLLNFEGVDNGLA